MTRPPEFKPLTSKSQAASLEGYYQLRDRVRRLEEALMKLVAAFCEDRAGGADWTEAVPAIIRLLEEE